MRRLTVRLWITFALLLGVACAEGAEYRETTDFADAVEVTKAYTDKYGPDETLLVVDIDNTLLTMQGDLGSDPWFEWQEYLLKYEPESPHLVADDFAGLLEVQGLLFQLGKMRPPQANLPDQIVTIQDLGVSTLVLTSRGPDFRVATERELADAGYDFARSCLPMTEAPPAAFLPYDPEHLEEVGLTADDAQRARLETARPVSLANGIYMTSGQHKGAMLLTALHRAKHRPKAVVFVDDHGRHIHRVYDTLSRHGIDVTVLHYKREDKNVARFRYSDKSDVTAQWNRLKSALNEVFALPSETKPPKPSDDQPQPTRRVPQDHVEETAGESSGG